ncbi:MAG: phosphoribosylamine--glycine ligase [Cyanobacteria bacterium P01_H01_bin.74]
MSPLKILLIGGGAREHAIAWKLAQSRHQPDLYFAPGNPGMEPLGQRLSIDVTDVDNLLRFAEKEAIELTVVGPEIPLSLGIADRFQAAGLKLFGPTKKAAQLETSKAFSKALMAKHNIPTAPYYFCETQAEAIAALDQFTPPYVIKQNGLAAGKGVTIAPTRDDAVTAIQCAFKKAMPVVIEGFLSGQELSVLTFCDGKTLWPCIAAQDYKRIGEGDTGPNTGGMGAYAPVPLATPSLTERINQQIIEPTMKALINETIDYQGILYFGLMIDKTQTPHVIEFNARFGDPETQVVLPLLKNDLVDIMLATVNRQLDSDFPNGLDFEASQSAVTVVLASHGYPGQYEVGKPISTDQAAMPECVLPFHAGTKNTRPQHSDTKSTWVTSGGRVLSVTATGTSLPEAVKKAYQGVDCIAFDGKTYRSDIAASF